MYTSQHRKNQQLRSVGSAIISSLSRDRPKRRRTRKTSPEIGVGAELTQSWVSTFYGINRGSFTQAVTPNRLLGRVYASTSYIGRDVVPLGAFLGETIGDRFGVPATMVVGACSGALAFLG